MKTGKTYVQVFIENEDDLPEKEGKYIAQNKSDRKVMNRIYHYDAKDYWMIKVNWYLLPVEQSQQDKSIGFFQVVTENNITKIYHNGKLIEPNFKCDIPLSMEDCKKLADIKNKYFKALKQQEDDEFGPVDLTNVESDKINIKSQQIELPSKKKIKELARQFHYKYPKGTFAENKWIEGANSIIDWIKQQMK